MHSFEMTGAKAERLTIAHTALPFRPAGHVVIVYGKRTRRSSWILTSTICPCQSAFCSYDNIIYPLPGIFVKPIRKHFSKKRELIQDSPYAEWNTTRPGMIALNPVNTRGQRHHEQVVLSSPKLTSEQYTLPEGFGRKEKRHKPRNHPANPVEKPDLPCITLSDVFCSFSGKTGIDRAPVPFHILPFWTAVAVRRQPADGSGTYLS